MLAWLKNQPPAANRVRALFLAAQKREVELAINIVNLGEVFYLVAKARDLEFAARAIQRLRTRVRVISASDELVMAAASLKARFALSYADAFAAASALATAAPLVTGDPEIADLARHESALQLEWIGT